MKKLLSIALLMIIIIGCSKKNDPQPQTGGGGSTPNSGNSGLYCAVFIERGGTSTVTYDTLGKQCLTSEQFGYYSHNPNPAFPGANTHYGWSINDCSECK